MAVKASLVVSVRITPEEEKQNRTIRAKAVGRVCRDPMISASRNKHHVRSVLRLLVLAEDKVHAPTTYGMDATPIRYLCVSGAKFERIPRMRSTHPQCVPKAQECGTVSHALNQFSLLVVLRAAVRSFRISHFRL